MNVDEALGLAKVLKEVPFVIHYKVAITLAAEVRRLREEVEWHPIESAPTDGTWIQAINTDNPNRQHIVHYSDRYGSKFPWVTDSAPMSFVAGLTHWMPLPGPPNG